MTAPLERAELVERLRDVLHKEACYDKVLCEDAATLLSEQAATIERLMGAHDTNVLMESASALTEAQHDITTLEVLNRALENTVKRLSTENASLRSRLTEAEQTIERLTEERDALRESKENIHRRAQKAEARLSDYERVLRDSCYLRDHDRGHDDHGGHCETHCAAVYGDVPCTCGADPVRKLLSPIPASQAEK